MEKSNVDKIKEALLYAPVGAFGFLKDNMPTFFSMFVSRGKRDVSKSAMNAEEKLQSTKEHGQFVAMGTPLAKTKAEQAAHDAKEKGEDIAKTTIDLALTAVNFLGDIVKNVTSKLGDESSAPTPSATPKVTTPAPTPSEWSPHPENVSGHIHTKETEEESDASSDDIHHDEPSFVPERYEAAVGDEFIAEPVDPQLPANIKSIYEKLSAPEIIDRLDAYSNNELSTIRSFETENRNRQTIIHAVNYRLDETL